MSTLIRVWGSKQLDYNNAPPLSISRIVVLLGLLVVSAVLEPKLALSIRTPIVDVILLSVRLNIEC